MRNLTEIWKGAENRERAGEQVSERAEYNKTKRRALLQFGRRAGKGFVEVGRDRDQGDNGEHCEHRADAGHPGRQRRALMKAAPTAEQRQRPECQHSQVMAVERTFRQFREEVKNRRQTDEPKPDLAEVVHIPPVHRRLQYAAHREEDQQQLGGRVNPREPEQRRQHEPLRDEERPFAALMKSEQGPNAEQEIAEKNNQRGVARHVEVVEAGAVAGQDANHARRDPQVP